ncbi:hypothetical protein SAMN06296427_11076 [Moheibacter sediminis]|uniref:Uncharacterized protein n=1 Tax=Moheibacter sediminis TaxID=1434700 RepID=A0A1W2CGV1_9FLAO|nr:hypothetical protein SAMN06296427_11076 [Moheibacter sediminis]
MNYGKVNKRLWTVLLAILALLFLAAIVVLDSGKVHI